jgi:flagellar basal body-associated protein FliL
MADQKDESKQQASGPSRKFSIRTLLILMGVLVLEAAAVSALFLLAGKPADVHASGAALDQAAMMEQPVELLAIEDRFQNTRTGRAYLYDTEIYIVVRQKHQEKIKADLESMHAQISTDVATIFRRAEPAHLLEPELSTLTRQIRAALDQRLGQDENGEPYVQEVLIRKCMQFRADL